MNLLADRIRLTPAVAPETAPVLEVAMLGHCPGNARLERLYRPGDRVFDELRRVIGFDAYYEAEKRYGTSAR